MTTTTIEATPSGAHLVSAMDAGYQLVLQMVDDFDDTTCSEAPAPHQPLVWFFGTSRAPRTTSTPCTRACPRR